jgi:hypothetical protein
MEFLGLDDWVAIGSATHRLLSHPGNASADGDHAVFGIDLGIEEPVGGDEEPTLGEIARLGLVLEVEWCLEHGEDAAVLLVLCLEDVAPQDHYPSLVSIGMSEEVPIRNGTPGFISELLGDGRSARIQAQNG